MYKFIQFMLLTPINWTYTRQFKNVKEKYQKTYTPNTKKNICVKNNKIFLIKNLLNGKRNIKANNRSF